MKAITTIPETNVTIQEEEIYRLKVEFFYLIQTRTETYMSTMSDHLHSCDEEHEYFLQTMFEQLAKKYSRLAWELFAKWCQMRSSDEGGSVEKGIEELMGEMASIPD